MKFVDLVLTSQAFEDEIDDYIDQWHDGDSEESLHEFLGFTWDEYALWAENPHALRRIFRSRKLGTKIPQETWGEIHMLAARSQTQQDPQIIKSWLESKGLL